MTLDAQVDSTAKDADRRRRWSIRSAPSLFARLGDGPLRLAASTACRKTWRSAEADLLSLEELDRCAAPSSRAAYASSGLPAASRWCDAAS